MTIRKRFTLEWWQTGIFKTSLMCIGIAAGAYWHTLFAPYIVPIAIVGFVLAAYMWYVWAKQ